MKSETVRVDWRVEKNQKPIIFNRFVNFSDVKIHHYRVMPGRMHEYIYPGHAISIPIVGSVTTEKHTPTGDFRKSYGNGESICLIPAGQPVRASWETELECLSIVLAPSLLSKAAFSPDTPEKIELMETFDARDDFIRHIGLALLSEMNTDEPLGRLYAESLVQTLTLHLLKNYRNGKPPEKQFSGGLSGYKLRRVTEFINAHLDEDLTLDEIAEAVGLSQFHFARAFKRTTGKTPQQYVTEQRINRAKQLLARPDLPLVEVSAQTGFKNQSHFTTIFRKFTAVTPKVWRESQLGKLDLAAANF